METACERVPQGLLGHLGFALLQLGFEHCGVSKTHCGYALTLLHEADGCCCGEAVWATAIYARHIDLNLGRYRERELVKCDVEIVNYEVIFLLALQQITPVLPSTTQ